MPGVIDWNEVCAKISRRSIGRSRDVGIRFEAFSDARKAGPMTAAADDVHILRLSGPVTLYESAHAREAPRRARAIRAHLRIDLETAGPWDLLAGLQLLVSVVNTGHKRGKSVKFRQVPGAVSRDRREFRTGGMVGRRGRIVSLIGLGEGGRCLPYSVAR